MTNHDRLQIMEAFTDALDRAMHADIISVDALISGFDRTEFPLRYYGERMRLRRCAASDCTTADGAPSWFTAVGRERYCSNTCRTRTNTRRYRARRRAEGQA